MIITALCLLRTADITGLAVCVPALAEQKREAGKKVPAQKKRSKKAKAGSVRQVGRKETSAGVRKQEAAVRNEIKQTQGQIEQNELQVKGNLALLENIKRDIDVQQKRVRDLKQREAGLAQKISAIEARIVSGEAHLSLLRDKYVAAVKKMRKARRNANPVAYVFASKNFQQAWRRMRYMRKFAEWRDNRETEIRHQIDVRDKHRRELAGSKRQLDVTLASQEEAQQVLRGKHQAQDETVARLRANGTALRSHLARKQAEANDLNSRISQLIAAEQEEARQAERRRREAEERAAAEKARMEREKAERESAEAVRQAAEARAAEQARKDAESDKPEQEKKKPEKKKDKPKKEPAKKSGRDKQKKQDTPDREARRQDYAEARGRRPRNKAEGNTAGETVKSSVSGSGFAAAKGSLPRPVSGRFDIISRFGRHALADMADVIYDNPGIDAVVSKGASAQAVYPGTVTGVYVLNGFSTVIIVNHGDYYTVYGNIGTPVVKKGDKVKQGQSLGHLVSDPEEGGRTTIHFEVWKNREKQNPEAWIR